MPQEIKNKRKKIKFQDVFIKRYYRATDEANQAIKKATIEKKLSRAKIALAVGISKGYTNHLLKNDRNFREDELQKILPFLNLLIPEDLREKFINIILIYVWNNGVYRKKERNSYFT